MHTYTARDLRRFWSFIQITDTCWIWTGSAPDRYGRFSLNNKLVSAHRLAYMLFIGDIPDGMHLDHICERPKCVNPRHLEPVAPFENLLRGNATPGKNARKTHCKRGHPFDSINTYYMPTGGRQCIQCKKDWADDNREKVRATGRASTRRYRERQHATKSS